MVKQFRRHEGEKGPGLDRSERGRRDYKTQETRAKGKDLGAKIARNKKRSPKSVK